MDVGVLVEPLPPPPVPLPEVPLPVPLSSVPDEPLLDVDWLAHHPERSGSFTASSSNVSVTEPWL